MFYQCIAASALFYAAHWQTYVSAKLRFGKFDVTEAQFCIIVIHIISAIFGVEIWSKQVGLRIFLSLFFKIISDDSNSFFMIYQLFFDFNFKFFFCFPYSSFLFF